MDLNLTNGINQELILPSYDIRLGYVVPETVLSSTSQDVSALQSQLSTIDNQVNKFNDVILLRKTLSSSGTLTSGWYDVNGITTNINVELNGEGKVGARFIFSNSDKSIQGGTAEVIIGNATSKFINVNDGTYSTGVYRLDVTNAIIEFFEFAPNEYRIVFGQAIVQNSVNNVANAPEQLNSSTPNNFFDDQLKRLDANGNNLVYLVTEDTTLKFDNANNVTSQNIILKKNEVVKWFNPTSFRVDKTSLIPSGAMSDILLGQLFFDTNNNPVAGKLFQGSSYNWSDNPKLKVKFDSQGHSFITDNNNGTFTIAQHSDFIQAGVTDIGVHKTDTTAVNGLLINGAFSNRKGVADTGQITSWFADDGNKQNQIGLTGDSKTKPDSRNAYFGIYGDLSISVVDANLTPKADNILETTENKYIDPKQAHSIVKSYTDNAGLWVPNKQYTVSNIFSFSTSNSSAVDSEGQSLEADKTYLGKYKIRLSGETSGLSLNDSEIAKIEVIGGLNSTTTVTTTPAPYIIPNQSSGAIHTSNTAYFVQIPQNSDVETLSLSFRDRRTLYDNGTRDIPLQTFTKSELLGSKVGWTNSAVNIGGNIFNRNSKNFSVNNTTYDYFVSARIANGGIYYVVQNTHVGNTNLYGAFENFKITWDEVTTSSGLRVENPGDTDVDKILFNAGNGKAIYRDPSFLRKRNTAVLSSNILWDTGVDGYMVILSGGQLAIKKTNSNETIFGTDSYTLSTGLSGGIAHKEITFNSSNNNFINCWTDTNLNLQTEGRESFCFTEVGTGNSYIISVKAKASYDNNEFLFIKK